MKKCLSLMPVLLLLNFSISFSQVTVLGNISGLPEGDSVYLVNYYMDTLDRSVVLNGCFNFKTTLELEGEALFVIINANGKQKYLPFFAESGSIKIGGELKKVLKGDFLVEGSRTQDDFYQLRALNNLNYELNKKFILEMGNATDSLLIRRLSKSIDSVNVQIKQNRENWLSNHPDSRYAPYFVLNGFSGYDQLKLYYGKLTGGALTSRYGVELKRKIKNLEGLELGKVFPNFILPSNEGHVVELVEVVKGNKYTVIDFWASWCTPCRAEAKKLKEIFDEYRSSGLGVVGFSLDKTPGPWLKALEQDRLPWPQVRELDERYSKDIYAISALPTIYVLDNKGRIIVKDQYGEILMDTLMKLFNKS